jgi:DNA polymerase
VRDLRRRYLEQLLELGERTLVLDAAVPREATAPAARDKTRGAGSAGVTEPAGERGGTAASAETTARAAGAGSGHSRTERDGARGRRGEPEMYPPGLAVEGPAPRADLFTADPVAALESLEAVARMVAACTRCALHATRTHTVPGQGNPRAGMVLVGEAPGATEDETGLAFVGRAGQLLTDILKAIGLAREEVFICNVLKCRPPSNRDPEPLEAAACSPYLHRQLELIRPKVILALGKPAANTLLQTNASLGDLRGKVHRYRGIPLVVTYHPAALLRNPHWKAPTWDDVRIARRLLDTAG